MHAKFVAALAAFVLLVAGAFIVGVGSREVRHEQADAASALSNLTTTLEGLIDPIVSLLMIILILGIVMGIVAYCRGMFGKRF